MKSIKPLKVSASLFIFSLFASAAQADNTNFPPANVFPQQVQPNMRATPRTMPQSLPRRAPMAMPTQPRQIQSYRRPVAPYVRQPNYSRPYARTAPTSRAMPRYPINPRQLSNIRNRTPYRNNINTRNNFPSPNNMMPFGNSGANSFNPFSGNSMPFSNGNGMMPKNPMNNMFGNNNNFNMPFFPSNNNKKRKKAWGTERNIWPDFYTDFTDEAWDTMTSGPRKLGTMPGGWRFPYISTPDPVTVSDAITNQFPPIMEEAGKMADFSDWGIFDNK